MDIQRLAQLVTTALLTGVTSPAPDQPAVTEAVQSLRDAVARLSGDPFAHTLMAKLRTLHVTSAQAEPWRVRVRFMVDSLSEAALLALGPQAKAALVLTQPSGTAADRSLDDAVTAEWEQTAAGSEELRHLPTELVTAGSDAASPPRPADANAVTRVGLALSQPSARHVAGIVAIEEGMTADLERRQGADHPDSLAARVRLAHLYRWAGRDSDAIETMQRVATSRERLLGSDHADTLAARSTLRSWQDC
ncbi:tetratricopeptide repeat protein [Couchioplanes caeruleus]|uniref:Tetratricopeptide repeat protein n=1 Tax=Couchioplanes caeruleus TaxID=56438 RepID=A0A3N1GM90_9ACTN|nr:tetratricopeptide repeat protein [Couchioplanes caeruleus]ROP31301.1 hypothetical protein EDD30_4196 [Couchioplanes caeruleus]